MVRPIDGRPGRIELTAQAVRPASVSSVVEARIEGFIRSGDLADRSRLPPERDLAALFGVSRTSIREAVRGLWLKGLVDRRQGRGTFVRTGAGEHDSVLRRLRGNGREQLTILNVLDFRAALEPPIAARAAERARPEDLEKLAAVLSELERTTNVQRAAELDADFHHGVALASQNPLLVEVVEFGARWLVATRQSALQGRRRRALSRASHRAILGAMLAHDAEGASAAMAQHVREVTAFVVLNLEKLYGTSEG
jgi:DNA-binding FadR family transcriptional regulator